MNIQIFGKNKCFDTKKAERWFKERRIKYQLIDLPRYGMSRRELESVRAAVGLDALIDPKAPDADLIKYPRRRTRAHGAPARVPGQYPHARRPQRKKATVGYCPEVWKGLVSKKSPRLSRLRNCPRRVCFV